MAYIHEYLGAILVIFVQYLAMICLYNIIFGVHLVVISVDLAWPQQLRCYTSQSHTSPYIIKIMAT